MQRFIFQTAGTKPLPTARLTWSPLECHFWPILTFQSVSGKMHRWTRRT